MPDALAGAHLGKEYWIVDRLGDGGMGVVYLVEHRGLHKQFAAKVLSRDLTENAEARARFEVEARAASQLDHENIISVTDYGIAVDGRPFIVMELLRGRPLDARLAEGPVSLAEAAAIVVPVCNALGEAHAYGIVHRDIKPENVFLVNRPGGRFHVKVVDFGIAKASLTTTKITKMGQVLGSPLFMAPEACRGEEVDGRADIYSVGVLLYQLCTGSLPFEDANVLKVLQMHASQPVRPPRQLAPDLPEAVEAVILKALAKDRNARFETVEDLAEALLAALPPGTDALLRQPVAATRTPVPGSVPAGLRSPTPMGRTPTPSTPRPGGITAALGSRTPTPAAPQLPEVPARPRTPVDAFSAGPTLMAAPGDTAGASTSPPAVRATGQGMTAAGRTTLGDMTAPPATTSSPAPATPPPEAVAGMTAQMAPPSRWKRLALPLVGLVALAGVTATLVARGGASSTPAAAAAAKEVAPSAAPLPVAEAPATTPPAPPSVETPPVPTPPPAETPTPPAAPTTVRLRVASTPAGAQVLLDGRLLGETPLDTELPVAAGTARLELRRAGHKKVEKEIELTADLVLDVPLPAAARPPRGHGDKKPPPDAPPPPGDLEIRGRR